MVALVHKVVGLILVVVGAILAPTPVPIGLVLLVLGLALLAPYFLPIQNLIRHLRVKHAVLDEKLVSWREKCPDVIRTTIDKTTP